MKEQFVTYEIALKLKELGFDEECLAYYYISKAISLNKYFNSDLDWNSLELQVISNSKFIAPEFYIAAPLWQQAISFLKSKGVLIAELWDGWEYGKDGEDFNYAKTLDEAVQKAIELIEQTK